MRKQLAAILVPTQQVALLLVLLRYSVMMLEVRIHVLVQKRLLTNVGQHEIGSGKGDVLVFAPANVAFSAEPGAAILDLPADLLHVGRVLFHLLQKAAVNAIVIVDDALLGCYLRHVIVGVTRCIFLLQILRIVPTEK